MIYINKHYNRCFATNMVANFDEVKSFETIQHQRGLAGVPMETSGDVTREEIKRICFQLWGIFKRYLYDLKQSSNITEEEYRPFSQDPPEQITEYMLNTGIPYFYALVGIKNLKKYIDKIDIIVGNLERLTRENFKEKVDKARENLLSKSDTAAPQSPPPDSPSGSTTDEVASTPGSSPVYELSPEAKQISPSSPPAANLSFGNEPAFKNVCDMLFPKDELKRTLSGTTVLETFGQSLPVSAVSDGFSLIVEGLERGFERIPPSVPAMLNQLGDTYPKIKTKINENFEDKKRNTCDLYTNLKDAFNRNTYILMYFKQLVGKEYEDTYIKAFPPTSRSLFEGGSKNKKITRRRKKLRKNTKNNKRVNQTLKRSVH